MPWIASIAGCIDGRGRVFCSVHLPHVTGSHVAKIRADSGAFDNEQCDWPGCGAVFVVEKNPHANGTPEQPYWLRRWLKNGAVVADHSRTVQVAP